MTPEQRCRTATEICKTAGDLAKDFFNQQESLVVDRKGHQDFVSQADRDVETLIRKLLNEAFPDDAIVGEEHAPQPGTSGFTWVIDPIDGTTNFVNDIPAWTVVIAGVETGQTVVGLIHDPCHGETFAAVRGQGATLNGKPLVIDDDRTIAEGTVAVGFSGRTEHRSVSRLVTALVEEGGVFARIASGALSLAYVAANRFIGFSEQHMNAWDCLAGQLIVSEAGGVVEDQDADAMIADGGRVIVGAPAVFDRLLEISEDAFAERS